MPLACIWLSLISKSTNDEVCDKKCVEQINHSLINVDQFLMKSLFSNYPKMSEPNFNSITTLKIPHRAIFGTVDTLKAWKVQFMSTSRCHNNEIKMIFSTNYSMPRMEFDAAAAPLKWCGFY